MKPMTIVLIGAVGIALYLFLRSSRISGTIGGVGVDLGLGGGPRPPIYNDETAQIIAAAGGAAGAILGGIGGLTD
jgi:hypothetical protein